MHKPIYNEYQIEHFDRLHDRIHFSCGEDKLDRYIKQIASQEMKKWATATFVMVRPPEKKVVGYYSLSSNRVDIDEWPEELCKILPPYKAVPVTLLGRLAIDKNYAGKRLGEYLLMDALYRSWITAREIGSVAVIVDAISDQARKFYQRYDFILFPKYTHRLFLHMQTINRIFI